jgi:hypothetical protein
MTRRPRGSEEQDAEPLERQSGEGFWEWVQRAGRSPLWLRARAAELERFPQGQRYFLERAELIEAGAELAEYPLFNGSGLRAV